MLAAVGDGVDDVEGAVSYIEHVCDLEKCVIRDYYADLRLARTVGFCLGMLGHAVTVGVLAVWAVGTHHYNPDLFYDAKWVKEADVARVLRAALGDQ